MKEETLTQALKMIQDKVLPNIPWQKWCVAGGAACHYPTAGDVDVWVFAKDDYEFENLCKQLHDKFCKDTKWQWSCNYTTTDSYAGAFNSYNTILGFKTKKLGELSVEGISKRVQIMVTQAASVEDLINAFDISSHSIAWQWDGLFPISTIGLAYKSPSLHPPKIINKTNPTASQDRLKKFTERYKAIWGKYWPKEEPTPIELDWSWNEYVMPNVFNVNYTGMPPTYSNITTVSWDIETQNSTGGLK